jgi:putative endonuclease
MRCVEGQSKVFSNAQKTHPISGEFFVCSWQASRLRSRQATVAIGACRESRRWRDRVVPPALPVPSLSRGACRGKQGTVNTRAAPKGTRFIDHGRLFALPSSMSDVEKYYLYILKCSDNTLYVGYTKNLKNRLFWHRSGFASQHTAQRLPVKLVYSEEHPDETSARHRENQIKRWSGVKKQALIKGDLMQLRKLSKSREV